MRNTPQASSNGGGRLPARPPLVIGCGALANELVELTRRAGLPPMDLTCLPASLHNRPERIPSAVQARIRRARADGYDRIFVAYADCGTGGLLDRVLESEGIARLEGAHCYEVYAGRAAFAALHDAEPGTFYLTDYLVRNFERLVVRGLGLDRHPELLPVYFGNYRRLVYLAQSGDAPLTELAAAAAARLGNLAFERRLVGLGELSGAIASFAPRATDRLASNAMLELRKRGTGIVSPQLEGLAVERGHGGDAGLAAGLTGARPLRESGRRGSRSARTRPTSAGTRPTSAGTRPTCAETLHPMHVARGGGRRRRSPEAAAVSEAAA